MLKHSFFIHYSSGKWQKLIRVIWDLLKLFSPANDGQDARHEDGATVIFTSGVFNAEWDNPILWHVKWDTSCLSVWFLMTHQCTSWLRRLYFSSNLVHCSSTLVVNSLTDRLHVKEALVSWDSGLNGSKQSARTRSTPTGFCFGSLEVCLSMILFF